MSKESFQLVLGDLGHAKNIAIQQNQSYKSMSKAGLFGTICYNPPEVILGDFNPENQTKCDIWSFGCTLYEIKKLKKLFNQKNEYEILEDILKIEKLIECLVIEFHNLNKKIYKLKKFVKQCNLRLVHVHVNNYGKVNKKKMPSVIELSFVKKKYCIKNNSVNFPIKNLDFPNNKLMPDKTIKFRNL